MDLAESPDVPDLADADVKHLAVEKIPVDLLAAADSPRLSGENPSHARMLAGSEERLPPILVHRPTMRVVDGMHRLRAVKLRGQKEIEARYIDGDEASAFVLAVRANITHGLPLTLADRRAAAARIISLYPHWSDRVIATTAGLAAKTVAALRDRLTGEKQQLDIRVGRDGRARPVNAAARRDIVARLLSENPGASLREVAHRAGVSPETVRSVRTRLAHDGTASMRRPTSNETRRDAGRPRLLQRPLDGKTADLDGASALRALRADPAFRSNERARFLLRLLAAYSILEECGGQFVENIPLHSMRRVASAARACAQEWQNFAERVEEQRLASFRRESLQ